MNRDFGNVWRKNLVTAGSWLGAGLLAPFLLTACGGGDSGSGFEEATTGSYHHLVVNKISVPTTAAQKNEFGLNLDGDPNDQPDNALGGILAVLAGQGIDTQGTIDAAIADGSVVLLSSVRADNFTDDNSVSWQVYLGADTPNPDFSGAGTFAIAADSPTNAKLKGGVSGGQYDSDPAQLTLKVALVEGGAPLTLNLIGARIVGQVSESSCNVKIGGAITKADLDTNILPEVVSLMNNVIATDPTSSSAMTILQLFDDNMNMTIELTELQQNELIGTLLAPDVDLLDASGTFNPRSDGENDSLSIGIKATCVKATIDPKPAGE